MINNRKLRNILNQEKNNLKRRSGYNFKSLLRGNFVSFLLTVCSAGVQDLKSFKTPWGIDAASSGLVDQPTRTLSPVGEPWSTSLHFSKTRRTKKQKNTNKIQLVSDFTNYYTQTQLNLTLEYATTAPQSTCVSSKEIQFFRCKNMFAREKSTKIIFTNMISQCKFLQRIRSARKLFCTEGELAFVRASWWS